MKSIFLNAFLSHVPSPNDHSTKKNLVSRLKGVSCSLFANRQKTHTDTQTYAKVNTEDIFSGFRIFSFNLIIKESNKNFFFYKGSN